MKKAILTGSNKSFIKLQNLHKILNAELILLKPDFSLIKNTSDHAPSAIADNLDKELVKKATRDIHNVLESWYRDKELKDLSINNKCSFGLVFESSIELLFYNLSQTYLGLLELSNNYDEIFLEKREDPRKVFVAEWLNKNKGFSFIILDSNKKNNKPTPFDPMMGFRDLKDHLKGNFLDSILKKLFKVIQSKPKNSVFIMDAGKLDGYLDYSKSSDSKFDLILPIRKNIKFALGHTIFWKRTSVRKKDNKIAMSIKNISTNGWNNETDVIPIDLLKEAIDFFTLPFWPMAKSYLNLYIELFQYYQPKAALFGSDGTEIPILAAYAASQSNIPTLVMPHGIPVWGGSNMHKNKEGPFDYYCSIGPYDKKNYLINGVRSEKVLDGKLPWFSKSSFNHIKLKHSKNIKKTALLLPLDTGFSINLNTTAIHQHLIDMIAVCKKCDIDIFAIKFRSKYELEAFGLKEGKNKILGHDINAYGAYGNLSDYFKDIDIVIGPFNSATAECALVNIDYYIYHDYSIYDNNPNMHKTPPTITHIAFDKKALEKNILNNKKFKDQYSKTTLVNISSNFEDACKDLDNIFQGISLK
tara:strand:- start:462 stop:2216 length:1755 start_codon:yes stop_codon:yes gene_type:complete